jgi:hypothetical protein
MMFSAVTEEKFRFNNSTSAADKLSPGIAAARTNYR